MKPKTKKLNVLAYLFLFCLLNSNGFLIVNALQISKHRTSKTNDLSPDRGIRLKKSSVLKKIMESSSSKKHHTKQLYHTSKNALQHQTLSKIDFMNSTRLTRAKMDPVTAALIVKYTAAAINKVLEYGINKINQRTTSILRRSVNSIEMAQGQWNLLLEGHCLFFRSVSRITKAYMMSSDYDHFVALHGDYEALKKSVKLANEAREKIGNFIDQKVMDTCGETENFLNGYVLLSEAKKKELQGKIKELARENGKTTANGLEYIVLKLRGKGPQAINNINNQQSALNSVIQIVSEPIAMLYDATSISSETVNDMLTIEANVGGTFTFDGEMREPNGFASVFNEKLGKWMEKISPLRSAITLYQESVTVGSKDKSIIGNKAFLAEVVRKAMVWALEILKIIEKIVQFKGKSYFPGWMELLESGMELLILFLKYASLWLTRKYALLNVESQKVLDEEIRKCEVYELIPESIKFTALLIGNLALTALKTLFGPFIDAALNVLKMAYNVYRIIRSINGYFKAKKDQKEIKLMNQITTDIITRHYAYERCASTYELYDMIKTLVSDRNSILESVPKPEANSAESQTNSVVEHRLMEKFVYDDVYTFLSTFTDIKINEANTAEIAFYRRMQSPITSIAVARNKKTMRGLIDSGYSQYIVLNGTISILVCRGCNNKTAIASISVATGSLQTLIAKMHEFNSINEDRMNILDISINTVPVYLNVTEEVVKVGGNYLIDFSVDINDDTVSLAAGKTLTATFEQKGFSNFERIKFYKTVYVLMFSTTIKQDFFVPNNYKHIIKLIELPNSKWLVLAPKISTLQKETAAVASGEILLEYSFAQGITSINDFVWLIPGSKDEFDDIYTQISPSLTTKESVLLQRDLLIKGTGAVQETAQSSDEVLLVLKNSVLCHPNAGCQFSDTAINSAFRINDEDAFKPEKNSHCTNSEELKCTSEDTWSKRRFNPMHCRSSEIFDFQINSNGAYNIICVEKSADQNQLEFDHNYIFRDYDRSRLTKKYSPGEVARSRNGFLPLFYTYQDINGRNQEIYVRPKFELGWVPLGQKIENHGKDIEINKRKGGKECCCWNEFFPVEKLSENLKKKQDNFDNQKPNNFLHFIRSYRVFVHLMKETKNNKKPGTLPTLKYYRSEYGIYFAARANSKFVDYDLGSNKPPDINDKNQGLYWLSKVYHLCGDVRLNWGDQIVFLPARLEENSNGLQFETNIEGDIFLQESSDPKQSTKIDRVYYIEIFAFKNANTPQMDLVVAQGGMPSDHRTLFDYGFRPLLVPYTLGTNINDGVLVNSKTNDESKVAFRIWVRDEFRLTKTRSSVCGT